MGDLHKGHQSLIRRSQKENQITVVSIFVNPKQFNNREDFQRYHRNLKTDCRILEREKADVLFAPSEKEIYPAGFQTSVQVTQLSKPLCGRYRPGHFEGVAAIVLKLFDIVQPQRAYFGMKDYQQYKIVERMTKDLDLPLKIVPCPIVREDDGLALSSRNRWLSSGERIRAASIYAGLKSVEESIRLGQKCDANLLRQNFRKKLNLVKGDKVEYLEIVDGENLVPLKIAKKPILIAAAVWIGKTRLIDNILLK